ncbi:glutamic acid-rich protein-like [Panonychus citri]|uniref:glutamic acid-rich protein-like n=1 Tax=Panonychus citri TaxID=50023 RepID=UPI002306F760|nr:glutamic acid-rich protein-like [Panonychus citri]
MSIASNRSRRPNAGSKMSEIANSKQEDDEFYKKTYGGFVEEENDNDFEPGSDDDVADANIGKNGESAEVDGKEHPPAKRLKTEAKPCDEAECDDDDDDDEEEEAEDDEDDDDDDDDDDEEGDDEEDDEEDVEEIVEDEEDEVEGEEGDDDEEADEAGEDSFETNSKEKSKNTDTEAIPESKAD